MNLIKTFFISFLLINVLFAQESGPKISAAKPNHDFGNIDANTIVSHEFEILNSGDGELVIEKVRASCGCTAADPGKNILQPGESTNIKIEFNSAGRSGRQLKYVYVFSNDKSNPQVRLSFTANISSEEQPLKTTTPGPRLSLSTKQYNFGKVAEGAPAVFSVLLKNIGQKELVIKEVKSSSEFISAVLQSETVKPGANTHLKIQIDTKSKKGVYTRTLTLSTNDPVEPQQTITLSINIVDGKS